MRQPKCEWNSEPRDLRMVRSWEVGGREGGREGWREGGREGLEEGKV